MKFIITLQKQILGSFILLVKKVFFSPPPPQETKVVMGRRFWGGNQEAQRVSARRGPAGLP